MRIKRILNFLIGILFQICLLRSKFALSLEHNKSNFLELKTPENTTMNYSSEANNYQFFIDATSLSSSQAIRCFWLETKSMMVFDLKGLKRPYKKKE
jgi:hypothetical protein